MGTKRILHLVKRGNSMHRSRYLTSRMRSKLVILLLVLCDVAVRHAASQSSSGKWAKKQAEKKWTIHMHSSRMRWHSALSDRNNLSCVTPSKIVKASHVLLSWMAMVLSCLVKLFRAKRKRQKQQVERKNDRIQHHEAHWNHYAANA